MNKRLSMRQTAFMASLIVGLLVNIPAITVTSHPQINPLSGAPGWGILFFRLLFYILFTFFFIELNRLGTSRKWYKGWKLGLFGWYLLNVLLFLLLIGLLVLLLRPETERPFLLVLSAYFRGFFVWASALLIGNFLSVVEHNRLMQTENEQFRQQSLLAQLEALKAQLNPHFLFNSLNTLSSLIREGSPHTQTYLSKLSQVLRYSLQVQDQRLVPFTEEMNFTTAYSFLLTLRFGDNLRIQNDLPADAPWLIPPMSLQLLIENAVKHNIISSAHPLTLHLSVDSGGEKILVSNLVQPKSWPEAGTGTGLANLENRYRLLTGRGIELLRKAGHFTVALPIIPSH